MKIAYKKGMLETIAVTDWDNIVSPLYDVSCRLLIQKPDDSRDIFDISTMSLPNKANFCLTQGVDVLICGAISNVGNTLLQNKKIKVLSWICGPVEEIIKAYRNNVSLTEMYAMPGCRRRMCRNRRQNRSMCRNRA
jgi:hypothetical protein